MTACSTASFRNDQNYLLQSYQLAWPEGQQIEDKSNLSYTLINNLKPKPNGRFLFIPRVWFHYTSSRPTDTTRLDDWKRKTLGEVPNLLRPSQQDANALNLRNILQARGYLDASVDYSLDSLAGYRSDVTFRLKPGNLYTIDSILFFSPDKQVEAEMNRNAAGTLFEKGKPFAYGLYGPEKERILQHLRNAGYVNINQASFEDLEADTTVKPFQVRLYQTLSTPPNDSVHISYRVRGCTVRFRAEGTDSVRFAGDTLVEGIHIVRSGNEWQVLPGQLVHAIRFRPGSKYREEDYTETLRLLSNLGVFKFVRIRPVLIPDAEAVDIDIELSESPKLEVGVDAEINYTNRSNAAGAGNLIGFSLSPSLRHRNLFQGAENTFFNLSGGVEFNPVPGTAFWNTVDLKAQNTFSIPRFRDYLGLWGVARGLTSGKLGTSRGNFWKTFDDYATAKLTAGAGYVLLLDFYRYQLANFSYGMELALGQDRRLLINHASLDYIRPFFFIQGEKIIKANPFLANSFSKQLFATIFFRDLTYVSKQTSSSQRLSRQTNVNLETGGAELWLINRLIDGIRGQERPFRLYATVFSQFLKTDWDFRWYYSFNQRNSLAARMQVGIAFPFGYTKEVPYIKQFYVGGPNSIRGWAARGLGPGGYIDSFSLTESNRLLFFQTGDLKWEFNLEWRFKAFWRINGAIFLDGGNVWTLRKDASRPGAQFQFNRTLPKVPYSPKGENDAFYRQVALSSGIGLRADFTYFLFRLDLGIPVRYPYRGTDGRYRANATEWTWRNVNLNFGLGLPF